MSRKQLTPLVSALSGRAVLAAIALAAIAGGIAGTAHAAGKAPAAKVAEITEMKDPLTSKPGDPAAGKKAFTNRRQGNCLSCHAVSSLAKEEQFHGLIGPSLDGVAGRYSIAELRLRIVDPKLVNPATIMPSFYKKKGLHRVSEKFRGKTILEAQQVEDILAYLATLK